ncbi:MAG TPA: phospho-N-acetylmuramoyl-pentapeptide-transferase [Candidatus Limnocylindrales bacterium]|nr:phospho-N-acetylmuramoyl-pentapeptide-transferase [Candidatus Limnocylindrales bacterium]
MKEHGVEFIQGLLLAFACMVILMPPYLRLLHWLGLGKQIRMDGPGSHLVKEGTPTMGGVLIVAVILVLAFLFDALDASTYSPLFVLAIVGALGAIDDYLNARTGIGIRGRHKIIWQLVVAIVVAVYVQNHFGFNGVRVPFVGNFEITNTILLPLIDRKIELGAILFILVAIFAIVGSSNGVNLTDGLDGLAGGTLVFAFITFLIIALLNDPPQENLAVVNAIVIGAILGFLWFNVHPAQVFMGDSGALSLGGMLAVVALITGQVLILPLIGIIFVLEVASDIIQVASYKLRGKRVFRMAPLHHHFELGGWDEEKITMRFWIVGALAGMLGVTLFVASITSIPK